jgi:hypothetical protein
MTQFTKVLEKLLDDGVFFVIVGGVAATTHGSSMATWDLDICYARDKGNLRKLAASLLPLHPRLRGAPEGLPFLWDAETLRRGLNFTLDTDLGELDLLGEVAGVGTYEQARNGAKFETVFGVRCYVISLPLLISAKRAAGRPKDMLALVELEALLEAQQDD